MSNQPIVNKRGLARLLEESMRAVFPEAREMDFSETEEGFFCDYLLDAALNPGSFEKIRTEAVRRGAGASWEPDRFSGAYENGDAAGRMLQRVYALAFPTPEALSEYRARQAEAALRDHKALGAKLDLFSSSSDVGQGLILWHPKGAMLRRILERFGQDAHVLNDYQWVYTPHIGRAGLWKTSGHLDFYRDAMYSPIDVDGEEYYLKPMNCPFHIQIYNSEPRSWRDLPFRMAEYGTVYRYELSGTLNGLTRVRGFTQDDAHILCTDEQIADEVKNALRFSLYILRSFGFSDFTAYLATKPEKKSIGDDALWEKATGVLRDAVVSEGLAYELDEGGGAFYGPKIDLKLRDALGREWQCSTIQFDFNLPERFEMAYIGADGKRHAPLMVHRALFGSLERFTALLIEHYAGEFPFWLSPVQIGVVPVREEHNAYCRALTAQLKRRGFRVALNDREEHMRNKIKAFSLEKVPYILVAGDREAEAGQFDVRSRKDGALGRMDIDAFAERLRPEIEPGIPQYIFG